MEAFALLLLAVAAAALAGAHARARKRNAGEARAEPAPDDARCAHCGIGNECRRSLSSLMQPGQAQGCPQAPDFAARAAFDRRA